MRTTRFLLLAVLAMLAGCDVLGSDDDRRDDLDDARDLWQSRRIEAYEYRYTHQCGECLPAFSRAYDVRVEGDAVVAIADAQTGDPPPAGYEARTVPALFALVEDAIGRADVLHVEYDPQLGHPTLFSVDYERRIADDEFAIRVEGLRRVEEPSSP
jgi:hypothetical protein